MNINIQSSNFLAKNVATVLPSLSVNLHFCAFKSVHSDPMTIYPQTLQVCSLISHNEA